MIESFIEIKEILNNIQNYENEEDIYRELKFSFSKADQLINQNIIEEADVLALCKQLQSIDNATVQTFVKMYFILRGYNNGNDVSERNSFYCVSDDNTLNESIDLLWKYKELYTKEEIAGIWIQYLSNLKNGTFLPDPFHSHNNGPYDESREEYFVNIIKDNDEILSYYFKYDLANNRNIIRRWILEGDWDRFIKYVSLTVINYKTSRIANSFDRTTIYRTLKGYMDDYLFRIETADNIIISTTINKQNIEPFQNALATITQIAIGTSAYKVLYSFVKEFLINTSASSEILKIIGFDEAQESTDPINELHDYIYRFLNTKKYKHDNNNHEYIQILKQLYNVKIDWEIDSLIDDGCELNYTMALDDIISSFYFLYCLDVVRLKTMMIVACIMNDNLTRGIELVNLLITNVKDKRKNKYLSWSSEAKLVIANVIEYFDPESRGYILRNRNVSDNQKDILEQIIDYAVSIMPNLEISIDSELGKLQKYLHPKSEDDNLIEKIYSDVEIIISYSKHMNEYPSYEINTKAQNIIRSLKKLDEKNRIDIISKIMNLFEESKDILAPVKFYTYMNELNAYMIDEHYYSLYLMNPFLFEKFISLPNVNQYDIKAIKNKLTPFLSQKEAANLDAMINKYYNPAIREG